MEIIQDDTMRKSRLICSKQKTKLTIEHFIWLQEQRPWQLMLVNLPLFFACDRGNEHLLFSSHSKPSFRHYVALISCPVPSFRRYNYFFLIFREPRRPPAERAVGNDEMLAGRHKPQILGRFIRSVNVNIGMGVVSDNIPFTPLRLIREDIKFRIGYPVANRSYSFIIILRC